MSSLGAPVFSTELFLHAYVRLQSNNVECNDKSTSHKGAHSIK